MGDKVDLAHLVAVQPDGGGAHHLAFLHRGADALGQVEGEGHLVFGVAVAGDGLRGVELRLRLSPALGQRHGGKGGGGIHQLPVPEGAEHPVQHLGALAVDVVEVRPQHHQAVGVAVPLGKGDEAPPRQGGEAGLHPPDVVPVVGVVGVQHQVGGAQLPLVFVQVCDRHDVAHRLGGLHVLGLGVAGRRDLGQVPGGGGVAVVVQPVHAGEGGGGAAQLGRPLVHPGHKGGQVAAGGVRRDDAGRVVGAGHHHPVEQVPAADRLADAQPDGGAVGVLDVGELLGEAGGDGDLLLHVQAALQIEQGGHHLGQAGHIAGLVGVLFQDGLAGVEVEEVDRLIGVGGRHRHGVGGQPLQSRTGQHGRQHSQGQGPAQQTFLHRQGLLRAQRPRALGWDTLKIPQNRQKRKVVF